MDDRGSWLRAPGGGDTSRITVDVTEHGHYAVVTVTGEIDVMTGGDLRAPLHDLIMRGIVDHILDLRAVSFLDSTGLGIIVGERKRLNDRGGTVRIVCGPGLVGKVIRLTAVDRLVDVHDSVAAAAAAIDSSRQH